MSFCKGSARRVRRVRRPPARVAVRVARFERPGSEGRALGVGQSQRCARRPGAASGLAGGMPGVAGSGLGAA